MPRPVMRLGKELKEVQEHPDPDIHLELYDPALHGTPATAASPSPSSSFVALHMHGDTDGEGAAEMIGRGRGSGTDLFTWLAVLKGPPGTPFEGGTYKLLLRVPHDYPMLPPTASFITKVFHPNVQFNTGEVCLDILKTRWSPAWTLNSVCRAILNLLAEPEPDSPFNCDAGNLIRLGDLEGYASVVRMYAIMYAGAPPFDDWNEGEAKKEEGQGQANAAHATTS